MDEGNQIWQAWLCFLPIPSCTLLQVDMTFQALGFGQEDKEEDLAGVLDIMGDDGCMMMDDEEEEEKK